MKNSGFPPFVPPLILTLAHNPCPVAPLLLVGVQLRQLGALVLPPEGKSTVPLQRPAVAEAPPATLVNLRLRDPVQHRLVDPRVHRNRALVAVPPAAGAVLGRPEEGAQPSPGILHEEVVGAGPPLLVALPHGLEELVHRIVPRMELVRLGSLVAERINRLKLLVRNQHLRHVILWNLGNRAVVATKLSEGRHFA